MIWKLFYRNENDEMGCERRCENRCVLINNYYKFKLALRSVDNLMKYWFFKANATDSNVENVKDLPSNSTSLQQVSAIWLGHDRIQASNLSHMVFLLVNKIISLVGNLTAKLHCFVLVWFFIACLRRAATHLARSLNEIERLDT